MTQERAAAPWSRTGDTSPPQKAAAPRAGGGSGGGRKPRTGQGQARTAAQAPQPQPDPRVLRRHPAVDHAGGLGASAGAWLSWWRSLVGSVTLYFYQQLPAGHGTARRTRARLGHPARPRRRGLRLAGRDVRRQIDAEHVSPNLRNAIIATEDRRFYWHLGVSPRGIVSAIRINLREGRGPLEGNGGSTITQQVAKLLCLGVPYDPAQWKSEADYEADCRSGGI